MNENNFPKLHNASWPGIVGKGQDSEPPISFDTMLNMTAAAQVDGIKFDGIDIGLLDPHINIDSTDDEIKALADKVGALNLSIGSLVAPIWGGPAMGSKEDRAQFVEMVRKGKKLSDRSGRKAARLPPGGGPAPRNQRGICDLLRLRDLSNLTPCLNLPIT